MKIHLGVALPLAAVLALGGYFVGARQERGGGVNAREATKPAPREERSPTDGTPARRAESAVRDEARAGGALAAPAGAGAEVPGAPRADLERTEREFREETVDARWSEGVTTTIQTVGGPKGIGLDVRAVE